MFSSSSGQEAALSRHKHGFKSRREHDVLFYFSGYFATKDFVTLVYFFLCICFFVCAYSYCAHMYSDSVFLYYITQHYDCIDISYIPIIFDTYDTSYLNSKSLSSLTKEQVFIQQTLEDLTSIAATLCVDCTTNNNAFTSLSMLWHVYDVQKIDVFAYSTIIELVYVLQESA